MKHIRRFAFGILFAIWAAATSHGLEIVGTTFERVTWAFDAWGREMFGWGFGVGRSLIFLSLVAGILFVVGGVIKDDNTESDQRWRDRLQGGWDDPPPMPPDYP